MRKKELTEINSIRKRGEEVSNLLQVGGQALFPIAREVEERHLDVGRALKENTTN